jgi:predicted RNA binding protein YcfA (HicA-like mRNA interferase family)
MGRTYTCKELIKIIESDGWYVVHKKGSHKKYRHPIKNGYVTIAFHTGEVNPKSANSILKQAGLW